MTSGSSDANVKLIHAILLEKLSTSLTDTIPKSTKRHIFSTISMPGKATAVIGMRRSGKTTFIHQVRLSRLKSGISREQLPYINFEDERLDGIAAEHLHLIVDDYYRRFPSFRGRKTVTWCFDEIQIVPGWEQFIRRMMDSEKVEVFLTGSSAALLSREIATAMRGRAWEVVIHPFSFREALVHQGSNGMTNSSFLTSSQRSELERSFLNYLNNGGFPEVQKLDTTDRYQLLRDYVDVAILRDVVERYRVTNVAGLRWMVRHLLGNPASLFSVGKFFSALKSQGFSISKDTVHELLAYLEDCFLIHAVWMEAGSERQRMVNPRKAYPADPGLIPVFDRTGRDNLGHALETSVFIELKRRRLEVSYVRTPSGNEVDFLVKKNDGKRELIQVCTSLKDPLTAHRELRALIDASDVFPNTSKRILILYRESSGIDIPTDVIIQPAYEWMLEIE